MTTALTVLIGAVGANGQSDDVTASGLTAEELKEYLPRITGVIRTRYELATEDGMGRFQVRNARVQVQGNVGPIFSYYINTDFCDRGKVKILDAWGRASIGYGVAVQGGQFRQPFGMDSFRGPNNYLFTNRSFIGKNMCNVRAVGAKIDWEMPFAPATLSAGIFSPHDMADHSDWTHQYDYAAKLTVKAGPATLYTGVQSRIPDSVRVNFWNIGAQLAVDRFTFEGEFMNEHYTGHRHRPCKGWLVTADYALPLKGRTWNQLSFQARFDGMTAYSNGKRDGAGQLVTNEPRRNRLTVGTTLSAILEKKLKTDVRLNFDKYFYPEGTAYKAIDGDRLSLELILAF